MLPASNRGAGSALNFPDVCKTPAPPAPFVPVPYPNIGLNMQSAPFSPFVNIGFMPATNMGTMKVLTSGDEAGAMGGLVTGIIKGPGRTTVGNPIVFVTGLPAESLLNPTSGNNMNAPVGAQIVPSVVNVFYTYAGVAERQPGPVEVSHLHALGVVARGESEEAEVACSVVTPGVAHVRVRLFSTHTDRDVFAALDGATERGLTAVILDLRGNRGGDARAALRVAGAWLPEGAEILRAREADGDEEPIFARGGPAYPFALFVLVDGETASAAELVAAALGHHARATLIGSRTYGKATAQAVVRSSDGTARYATVAEYVLPDGARIDGAGVTPHHAVAPGAALELAITLASAAR